MSRNVFIYCRVSSQKQVQEGNGLESQEARCLKKAEELGYTVTGVFREKGITGCSDSRPALTEMLDSIRDFRAQNKSAAIVVLFDEIARLARDLGVHIKLKDHIEKDLKARVEYVSYKFDNTPEGKTLELIYSVFASHEREVNKRRVIERMHSRFQDGVDVYGRAKLGYRYQHMTVGKGKIQTPHPYNAPIVAEALKQYAYGKLTSAKQVKEYLDTHEIVHEEGKRCGRARITELSTVRKMLDNAYFYAGFIKNGKNGFNLQLGKHERLIDVDTYEAILERMGKRNNFYQKASELDYPLKGWLHCSECDRSLTSNGKGSRGSGKKRYHYYYCRNQSCSLYKKSRPTHIVHNEFEEWLWENKCSPELIEACEGIVIKQWKDRIHNKKLNLSKAKHDLRDVEYKILQCTNQLIAHSEQYVIENVKHLMKELTAEKVKLEAQIAQKPENDYDIEELVERVNWLLRDPLAVWKKGDINIKRCLLSLLFPHKLTLSRWSTCRKRCDPLVSAAIKAFCDEESVLVDITPTTTNQLISTLQDWNAVLNAQCNAMQRAATSVGVGF